MKPNFAHPRGFTLVELLVAMTVGLLISGVAAAVFITSKTTARFGDALARYQEGFRYASHILGRDMRMAGFFGCNSGRTPLTVASGMPAELAYDTPVRGYDDASAAIAGRIAGTDVIKLQFGAGGGYRLSSDMATADAAININALAGDFVAGDYAVIADCSNSTLFKVTGVTGSGAPLALSHGAAGNSSASVASPYARTAEVFDFITSYYYAATSADKRHVLMRRTLRGGSASDEEIAEGIDDLRFLYGIDTDGDTTANKYVRAADVGDWSRVLSVRVCLLTSSLDDGLATAPQIYYDCDGGAVTARDRRLHAPAFFTVSLRNRTG